MRQETVAGIEMVIIGIFLAFAPDAKSFKYSSQDPQRCIARSRISVVTGCYKLTMIFSVFPMEKNTALM